MKVKRMVKRLFAVGTGVAMLGATAMGAMAADLSGWGTGDLFVKDGVLDALIVVGATSKAEDTLAAVDIASNVPYSVSSAGGAVTLTGDSWLVDTSSKHLEMANSNASSSSITGEDFRAITTFIGDDELGALADGTWSTSESDYDYRQFLFFDDEGETSLEKSRIVKYVENDQQESADHLLIKNTQQIARYKLEFSSTAQSDVTDSDGTASTTGTYLDDFENTDLSLMGKDFSVVLARRTSSGATLNQNGAKLTLMAGSARDTLLEGESKTYTVGDKTYDVTLSFTDLDEAKFIVNGESTNKLKVGETSVLKDKSEVGVSEILYQAYAGGVHSATFFVGAQKMILQDNDVSAIGTGEKKITIGSEDVDGSLVFITGTDDNTTFTVSTIEVNMTADDDYFVGAGEKLSDVIEAAGEEKEVLMANAFDIEYKGLTEEAEHDMKIKSSSSRRYKLELYDGDGNVVDIPIVYADSQYNLSMGEESQIGTRAGQKWLILNESLDIYKDDYLVLTGGDASAGSAKSYLLQYKGADKQTDTSPKIKFKNMGATDSLEYSVSTQTTTGTVATIKLGGYSFIVQNASLATLDDFQVNVDLDGGGDILTAHDTADTNNAGNIAFVDQYGAQWAFQDDSPRNVTTGYVTPPGTAIATDTFRWTVSTPNSNDYDNQAPENIILNVTGASGPEVRMAQTGVTLVTPDGETEVAYGYTSMGSFIKFTSPSSDPNELTLSYPEEQEFPQVFFTSGATSSVKKSGKTALAKVVDATKLDTEVTSLWAQNTILVGGPCVNSMAFEAMGKPAQCAEGFEAGKSMVKVFESNGNTAMLVAGFSGQDTSTSSQARTFQRRGSSCSVYRS